MLNMKKGLAIALAAATALTFAPVSTLGLPSSVTAYAASLSDGTTENAGLYTASGSAKEWDGAANATVTVNGTADGTDATNYFFVKLTTVKTNAKKISVTVKNTKGSNVERFNAGDELKGGDYTSSAAEDGSPLNKVLAFHATGKGDATYEVTYDSDTSETTTPTKKLTLNFHITGAVSTAPTFKYGNQSAKDGGTFTMYKDAGAQSISFDFPNEIDGNTFSYAEDSNNNGILGTVTAADNTVNKATNPTVSVTPSRVGTAKLNVYTVKTTDQATAKPAYTLNIKVVNATPKVVAKDVKKGGSAQFSYTSVDTSAPTVTIYDPNGNDVTTKMFDLYEDNGSGTASNVGFPETTPAAYTDVPFWVVPNANAKVANGYTITVQQTGKGIASAKFNVTAGDSNPSGDGSQNPTVASKSAVYGGVTTELLATDNTTYSLVNSNARFKLNGKWYTADQLKWYITSQVSAYPTQMGFTNSSARLTGTNRGKLDVHVNNAKNFESDMRGVSIVGIDESGAQNTLVYSGSINVTGEDQSVVTKKIDVSFSKKLDEVRTDPVQKDFLSGKTFIGVNNRYLNADTLSITSGVYNGQIFDADVTASAKDSKINRHTDGSTTVTPIGNGVYYEKYYVPYTDTTNGGSTQFIAEINVAISVNAGPTIRVEDGDITYSDTNKTPDDAKVIDLDLTTNKTFDLAKYTYSDMDGTTYAYKPFDENVTVDAKGVVTAQKVGTSIVEITPSANGVAGSPVYVFFRVNQNAKDSITVAGKDGDKATVLTNRQYRSNLRKLSTEEGLAKAQVGYVQIEVTGDETADVKEPLTVKGAGNLSFDLVNENNESNNVSVDAKTGQITVSHAFLQDHFKNAGPNVQPYVFAVKVTSTETDTSALTTGYFNVVVDYADAQITGLEDSYEVGTSLKDTDASSWLYLGPYDTEGVKHVSTNASASSAYYDVRALSREDDLNDSALYTDDDNTVFVPGTRAVKYAIAAGKTEHVLVTNYDTTHKIGHTYKVVTIKSVAGQENYVTKIENVATGKTIYEQGAGVNTGASITIDKATVVKVTVAHAPSASLNAKVDPAFTLAERRDTAAEDGFNYNTENLFIAATENPKTYEITLIPSMEGTQIVTIYPTQGRLSTTDYSLVDSEDFKLAVKNDSNASIAPKKVTGLKVKNKKGAKVSVTWTAQDKTVLYRVYKKVGNGSWKAKNVTNAKATLEVKKGAKVQVKVKAFRRDENGKAVWQSGKATKAKTFKTDKK